MRTTIALYGASGNILFPKSCCATTKIVDIAVSIQLPLAAQQEQTFSSIHPPLLHHHRPRAFPAPCHGVHHRLVVPGGGAESRQVYIVSEDIAVVEFLLNRSG